MPRIRTFAVLGAVLALAIVLPAPAEARSPEQRMVQLINKTRARHGLGALHVSPSLRGSSSRYAGFMLRHNYFGHLRHVSASGAFRRVGEALAAQTGRRARPHGVLRGWLHSPPHRHIVLSRRYHYVGVGLRYGRLGGRKMSVWVAQLGSH
jgi:uncharacterized protein YkwD